MSEELTEAEQLDILTGIVRQQRDKLGLPSTPFSNALISLEEAVIDTQADADWLLSQAAAGRVPACLLDGKLMFPRDPLKSAIVRMAKGIIPPGMGEYSPVACGPVES